MGDDTSWQVQDGGTGFASPVNLADAGLGPSCTTRGELDLVPISGNVDVHP